MTDKDKQHKQCSRCKETLPMGAFYYTGGRYTAKCRPCTISYNMERRDLGPKRPKKKVSQTDAHRKILSNLGPGIVSLRGRYIHGYREFFLYTCPQGMVVDGELIYGTHTVDDILYTLHNRHMRLIEVVSRDEDLNTMIEAIAQLRNSCGDPISVRFVKGLVSRPQYFLWMDEPRKLLISEVSDQLKIDLEVIKFLIQEKTSVTENNTHPGNIKNTEQETPQVIDNTLEFVEE